MAMFMRKLNAIARCSGLYRTQNADTQLPDIYHSYVHAICRNPGMSQDKLSKHLCINKSSVTRHLAYLEQNAYIERKVSCEDKREMLVYPSPKMLDAHPEIVRISKQWNDLLSEGIGEEELHVFMSVLDKLYEKAKQISTNGDESE